MKDNKYQNSNYWLQTIIFKNPKVKNLFLKLSKKNNINLINCWEPLHIQKHLKKYSSDNLSNTLNLQKCILHLPSNFIK